MAMASPQFRQLPMFMSAREIRSQYSPWPGDRFEVQTRQGLRDETDAEMWNRKRRQASQGSLDRKILSEGVRNPVYLESPDPKEPLDRGPYLLGGHHRIAVMSEHKPDALVPVEHFQNPETAHDLERRARGSR